MTYPEFRQQYHYNESTDRIGGGGFGVVYKALDTHVTIGERWVAVKTPKQGHEHDEAIGIVKEAQIVLLQPDNPYIARYFEFHDFRNEDRGEVAVMQYYEEGNLRKIMGKISQSEKETILEQILDGIGFLHSLKLKPDDRFIIHKDLKPENILIEKLGDNYIPKISDFGISKLAGRNYPDYVASNDGILNQRYAAPEQFTNPVISRNVDLYSFGIIAVEVFTGEHPYDNPEAKNKDTIPENWRRLIYKCIVTDPKDRVQSVAECKEILYSQPSLPREPIPTDLVPIKKFPWKYLLWSLFAILVLALLLYFSYPRLKAYFGELEHPKQTEQIDNTLPARQNNKETKQPNTQGNTVEVPGNALSAQDVENKKQEVPSTIPPKIPKEKENESSTSTPASSDNKPAKTSETSEVAQPSASNFLKALDMQMVTVQGNGFNFEIGKYEVTQRQWELVMGNNPSRFKGDNLPVQNVSWNDTQQFIKKLNEKTGKNYRLPTGREWQYAANGGNKSKGYKYSGSNNIDEVAWYEDNSGGRPHSVRNKKYNELEIYDMSGNVGELCDDQMIYGGNWFGTEEACLVKGTPEDMGPNYKMSEVGFRLARTLDNVNNNDKQSSSIKENGNITNNLTEGIKTITETGIGSNFSKYKAIELAKEDALKNLENRRGLTKEQIRNSEFSEPKIDSLPNKIYATIEVRVNIKK